MKVSIIICTADRPASLRKSLASIVASASAMRPVEAEVLVIDNGTGDGTAAVAREMGGGEVLLRYVREPRRGLDNARNRGLAEAAGDLLLYADDDVLAPANWAAAMCAPMLSGTGDAVCGGIRIAPWHVRPWMTMRHRLLLTTTEHVSPDQIDFVTGASMGFARRVLARVPGFDPELDAGALGYMGETLFARQLLAAGFRIASGLHVVVDHDFDAGRLSRSFFRGAVARSARSAAYIAYHWEHRDAPPAPRRPWRARAELLAGRVLRRRQIRDELLPKWEHDRLYDLEFHRQFEVERRRPRNYERHGLVKIAGAVDA